MYNKCQLIGNLGKDPEVRTLGSGKKVCNFSVATSETYKDKAGQKQTKTEWHNIIVWEKLAEICEKYLKKGSKVFIEGKIAYTSYEKDGITKYSTNIVCHELKMLDSAKEKPAANKEEDAWQKNENEFKQSDNKGSIEEDDLPF